MMVSWVVVIALAVWLVLYLRPNQPTGTPKRQSDAEVLAGRFARGEIDDEEFTRRRDVLGAEKQGSS